MSSAIAGIIDRQIYLQYRFYACNYVAYDMLYQTNRFADNYGLEDKRKFDSYLQTQLNKIDLPNKDEVYLRRKLLEMYSNPLKNYLSVVD